MPEGSAPPISGVVETGLYVDDIARARAFYEEVLGLEPMVVDERFCAYGVGPASVLLLFRRGYTRQPVALPGGTIPPHDGEGNSHFALAIPGSTLDAWTAHLKRVEVVLESRVDWPKGGTSLYFRDPDGHLVELATPGLWTNY